MRFLVVWCLLMMGACAPKKPLPPLQTVDLTGPRPRTIPR